MEAPPASGKAGLQASRLPPSSSGEQAPPNVEDSIEIDAFSPLGELLQKLVLGVIAPEKETKTCNTEKEQASRSLEATVRNRPAERQLD